MNILRKILTFIVVICIMCGCGNYEDNVEKTEETPEDPGIKSLRIGENVWEIQFPDEYYTLYIYEQAPDIYDNIVMNNLYQVYKERKTTPNEEWEIIEIEYLGGKRFHRSIYEAVSSKGLVFYKSAFDRSDEEVIKAVDAAWQTYMK